MAGGNKTTSTSTSEPYAAFKPLLDQAGKDALSLYGSGGMSPVYTGSTVVPYADQTLAAYKGQQKMGQLARPVARNALKGLDQILDNNGFNKRMNQAVGEVQTILNNNGFNRRMNDAYKDMKPFANGAGNVSVDQVNKLGQQATDGRYQGQFQDFAKGSGDVSTSALSGLAQQAMNNPYSSFFSGAAGGSLDLSNAAQKALIQSALNNPALAGFGQMSQQGGPSYSEQNLSAIARGDLLDREDPNLERLLERASQKASDQVALQAGSMGRFGGGVHQGTVAREVGDMQAQARLEQYQRERDAQVQANSMMDQYRLADDATRLNALSGLGSTYSTGQGQSLNAANSASQIDAGNRDARFRAAEFGSNDYRTGLNQALGAEQSVANIAGQNQDRRYNALTGGASDFRSGINQGLNAQQLSTSVQGQNKDRQMTGATNLFNMGQQGMTNRIGAANDLYDMGQGAINNRLNATSQIGNTYQDLLDTYQPAFNTGSAMEDLYGRTLNDQIRIEQGAQNQQLNSIQQLLSLFGGGQFSTQQQTAQGPNSTGSNIAGLGLGALSLLGRGAGWWP